MSNLKELIDQLYEEVTRLPKDPDGGAYPNEDSIDQDIDIDRLHRAVAQMTTCLQIEDLKDMQEQQPVVAEDVARLLLQWENLCNSVAGLKRHIQELDADIARMQPWGDFDVVKVEQLRQYDCHIRFWRMPVSCIASMSSEPWYTDLQVTVISHDQSDAYFVTISLGDETPNLPQQAKEIEICPCPVSTLIMLQTRDKDSLKRTQNLQGDFALAHYAELRETLRLLLPPGVELPKKKISHRQAIKARLKKVFHKG